ncbi:MAG TPA: hypothetical protein VHQ90_20610 [Thermoanaerobaculia bacterium]|nr:hypothetical protein [Thermoanaerobaculia bacterium]
MAPRRVSSRIHPGDLEFLAARGARPSRCDRIFSRSAVLHRTLLQLHLVLERADTEARQRLGDPLYLLLLRTIRAPARLSPFEIENLAAFLERLPTFRAALAERSIDPAAASAALEALSVAERVALVDAAVRLQTAAATAGGEAGPARGRGAGPGGS